MSNDYGLKVGDNNVAADIATPQQTRYSSKYSNFKYYTVLTVSVTATAASPNASGTVANPLSYGPFFLAYVSIGNATTRFRLANQADLSVSWEQDTDLLGCDVSYRPGTNDFSVNVSTSVVVDTVYTFKIVIFVDKVSGASASIAGGKDLGLRISKTGKAVKTADDTDMSMTSEFKSLTVLASGTADVTWSGSSYIPGVAHNLGYIPLFLTFFSNTGEADVLQYTPVPTTFAFHSTVDNSLRAGFAEAWIDNNNLFFQTDHVSPSKKFKYLIFDQRLV